MSQRSRRLWPVALVSAALLGATGCVSESIFSVSASLDSLGASVASSSSPFRSSSESSSPGTQREREYRDDVRDFVAAYVQSGGRYETFEPTLAELAQKHGITDWEGSRATWLGVGEGLAKARVEGAAFDTYARNLSGGDPARMDAIGEGYRSAQR